jgi:hypothetical protein
VAGDRGFAGFRTAGDGSFDADGERPVSGVHSVWFRNGGWRLWAENGVNRKFTPNQIIRVFRKFSPN